jgi:predicted metalloprotease with PDZ domain
MLLRFRLLAARAGLAAALVIVWCAASAAQQSAPYRITYHLSMPRPASHLFEVRIGIEAMPLPDAVDVQMPKWSPGRYAVFDFAKNVQEVRAAPGVCLANCNRIETLPVARVDDQTWRINTRGQQGVTLSYKVYGDDLSGTFSQLDARHACVNGASVFMYVVGHKQDAVALRIDPPADWRIINGRMDRMDQREWQFPNYDLLIDTPTMIGPNWTLDEFQVEGKTYRVAVSSFGDEGGKRPALVKDIEKIVRAEVAMWGAPDFDSYTFLLYFAADDESGDGMEHLTSTLIVEPGALADPGVYESILDTVAHEFFHVWNVKRLRPAELGPWDFTRPANTRGLWIAEGLTNYYGHLMLRRAGIWTDEQLLEKFSGAISEIENSPGRTLMSAEDASLSAPFLDDAPHAQKTNLANTSVSYYTKGEVLGLALDLLIRARTGGQRSLDDVMRRMYEEFYLKSPNATYYLKGRGYTGEDFERVASEVAGENLHGFFVKYVRGIETLPYDELFRAVGLRLVRAAANEPYTAGIVLAGGEPNAVIGEVRPNSPAENAGLKRGDIIISIGENNVTRATWRAALNSYKPRSRIPISVRRGRQLIKTSLALDAPDAFEYSLEALKEAGPEARALREAWLSGRGARAATTER